MDLPPPLSFKPYPFYLLKEMITLKHPIPKLISALLTIALLTALFPAASAATGTTPIWETQTLTCTKSDDTTITIRCTLMLYKNYAAGKSLVLLGTEGTPVTATYGGQTMIEVTPANYKLDGQEDFTHTYAIVMNATSVTFDQVSVTYIDSTNVTNAKDILSNLLHYDCDVDRNGGVNIRDAQTVAYIYFGSMGLTNDNMKTWLLADADANGKVDADDIRAILAAAHR